jgi:signal transduction histidine kinase
MRGFSHDVKNPLGAADGFLQMMQEEIYGGLTEELKTGVTHARRSIRSALALIDDLLDLARAEAGEIEISWTPTDVRQAVAEVTDEYRPQVEARGLTLRADVPKSIPLTLSDASRVRQITGNLLSNAAKYTEQGSITVRIARCDTEAESEPGSWITVAVSDTGRGISADDLHLLFQEFSRLGVDTVRGTGLGLAISQRIAHALGGRISVESEKGRGSTFTLWIPQISPEADASVRREMMSERKDAA